MNLHGFDATSGDRLWTTDDNHGAVEGANQYHDGRFYVTSLGRLLALQPRNGELFWETELGKLVHGSAVGSDAVFATTGSDNEPGSVYCLDIESGGVRWERTGIKSYAAPSVGMGLVFVVTTNGDLVALSMNDGKISWRIDVAANQLLATAAVNESENRVYLSTGGRGTVLAVDARTGRKIWEQSLGAYVGSPVVIFEDGLLTGTNRIVVLDPTNGTERWSYDIPVTAPPVVSGGGSLYVNANGEVVSWATR